MSMLWPCSYVMRSFRRDDLSQQSFPRVLSLLVRGRQRLACFKMIEVLKKSYDERFDISYVLGLFCLFVLYYWVRILKQIIEFEIVYCVENLLAML